MKSKLSTTTTQAFKRGKMTQIPTRTTRMDEKAQRLEHPLHDEAAQRHDHPDGKRIVLPLPPGQMSRVQQDQHQHDQRQVQSELHKRKYQPPPQEPHPQMLQSNLHPQSRLPPRQGLPQPQTPQPQRLLLQQPRLPQIAAPRVPSGSGDMASPSGKGFAMGVPSSQGFAHHQQHRQQQHHNQQQQHHQQQKQQEIKRLQAQAQQQHQKLLQEQAQQAHVQQVVAMQRHQQFQQQQQQEQAATKTGPLQPALQPAQQRKLKGVLEGYLPPAEYQQLDVSVVMHHNETVLARWEKLLDTLDISSDAASVNMMAQVELRTSLKQDLARLTKLADAQTKFIQKLKLLKTQHHQQQQEQPPPPPHGGMHQTPGLGGGLQPIISQAQGHLGSMPPQATATPTSAGQGSLSIDSQSPHVPHLRYSGVPGPVVSQGIMGSPRISHQPPPQPPQNQHQHQQQQQLQTDQHQQQKQAIGQRLMQTRKEDRWVVMVDASLRLPPNDGASFEDYVRMALRCVQVYNNANKKIMEGLRSCIEPNVLSPTAIQPAQQALASLYTRWTQGGFH